MTLLTNKRDFKKKQELIVFNDIASKKDGSTVLTIIEAKELHNELGKRIMFAESNELISTLLRSFGMDEAQVETAVTQLNKLREKL